MKTIWLSPTGFVTGDPELEISYPFVGHPSTMVRSPLTTGDFKWVSMGLPLPPDVGIESVTVCYQISTSSPQTPPTSLISQVRLTEMNTPNQAIVRHDDPTDLESTIPDCYTSKTPAFVPSAAVTLALRLNFQATADQILLGAVGVNIQPKTEPLASAQELGLSAVGINEPESECKTRAPIPWEWSPYNYFLDMWNYDGQEANPERFEKILQSLRDNQLEVMAGSGFVGVVPFDWGYRGAVKGQFDPLLGGSSSEPANPLTGYGRLPPDQLAERIGKIEQYAGALHRRGKVRRVMPYIDFGTQMLGRHNRPDNVPPSVWGFWEFYDHWEEYAEPAGPFGLGPRPPDPTTWLAKWHDANGKVWPAPTSPDSPPEIPDELTGLSFAYYPVKPGYGPSYRYKTCPNTVGWILWWKQVIQWMARVGYDGAFIDNAYFTSCWNDECQEGYSNWLNNRYTINEIRRYFTSTTNNLLIDPGVEGPWTQEIQGQWRAAAWGTYPAQASPIFPDTAAFGGRYACRIKGPGGGDVAYFSHITQGVPADHNLRLTFYYKTSGIVEVKAVIAMAVAPDFERILTLENAWKQEAIDFHTLPDISGNVNFYLRFEVRGTGTVWLDEFWLGKGDQPPEFRVELWRPSDDPFNPLRLRAALAYWSQVADEKLGYLRQRAREVNPQFELFTNGFHTVNVDYFMSEGLAIDLNHYRLDVGFFPGIYLPLDPPTEIGTGIKANPAALAESLLVSNIFDYKYIHSRRLPGSFSYHMPQWRHAAASGYYHNPDSALLNLAEAAAFGGGAGCDNLLRHNYGHYGSDFTLLTGAGADIREREKEFFAFIDAHRHRFSGYRSHADVGIVYHDLPYNGPTYVEFQNIMDLAKGLASAGVLWDIVTENRCNKKSFSRLRALVYQDVSLISEAEAQAVLEFIGEGGLVIAGKMVGDVDEWFRMRLPDPAVAWPPVGLPPTGDLTRSRPAAIQLQGGKGKLVYQPDALTADQVIAHVEAHLGRTVQMATNISPEALSRIRLNAWVRDDGGGTITVHILNYNVPLGIENAGQVQAVNNVQVSVPLVPQFQVESVRLYSPENDDPPQEVAFNIGNGLITFEIPSLRIYAMAVIE